MIAKPPARALLAFARLVLWMTAAMVALLGCGSSGSSAADAAASEAATLASSSGSDAAPARPDATDAARFTDASSATDASGSTASDGARSSSSTANPPPADAGTDASTPDASTDGATLVVVHYPLDAGHRITMRGSGGPLNWDGGVAMSPEDTDAGTTHTWTLSPSISSPIQVKPLYDDATWAIGPNWDVNPGERVDIWPHFFTQNGAITEIDGWYSSVLDNSRTVWVYTPPSYAENPDESFPVAYFQDGQNDLYDSQSYSGVSWDLEGAMDQGALDGTIHETILVCIANAGAGRVWEYTPTNGGMDGGGAPLYVDFVATEVKPKIDTEYRTEPARASTAICGSSLGGLVSIYAGLVNTQTFGLIGALSPSTWWDGEWVLPQVEATIGAPLLPIRVYLDSGNAGVFAQPDPWPAQANYDDWTQTAQLAQAYAQTGVDLDYLVQDGGQHSEVYWKQRVPGTLAFLFGPR